MSNPTGLIARIGDKQIPCWIIGEADTDPSKPIFAKEKLNPDAEHLVFLPDIITFTYGAQPAELKH